MLTTSLSDLEEQNGMQIMFINQLKTTTTTTKSNLYIFYIYTFNNKVHNVN